MDLPDKHWVEELQRIGGSIHQDNDPPLTAAEETEHQAEITRYHEMLDSLDGNAEALSHDAVARAILWSLHPIDDYGIYEAAYSALRNFAPRALAQASGDVLPEWLARFGDHTSIQTALTVTAWDDEALDLLIEEGRKWTTEQRSLVKETIDQWAREDDAWEPLLESLGGELPQPAITAIPADWPRDWRAAAQAFRDTGRVDLAWTNERDFSSNFDRVLSIMELDHGARWRDVPDLLNPLMIRRRNELPAFIRALAQLPEGQFARVIANIERARPDLAAKLLADVTAER